MSSFLPSSSSQTNAGSGTGTIQRSTVNNAAADALRKKMQQLRDELEQVKDDLERSRKELEKERNGREVVSFFINNKLINKNNFIFRLTLKLVN
jgi:predicted RNase H-like nuclease (RuvC/YqgF family)